MKEYIKKYKVPIAMGIIILLEFALFRTYVQRNIIGSCPRKIDQAVFMRMTYHMYENIVAGNYAEAVREIINGLGQGAFPVFGLISMFLFGKSRLSLLLVNFILFVTAQLTGFRCIKKISGSDRLGFCFMGLFLMLQSPFFEAGDLVDYRMDFAGFCLYTCWICTFAAAHYKRDKKLYLQSAVFAGLLLMFRLNTIAYLGIAFMLFECVYVFVLKQEKFTDELKHLLQYAGVVLLSGGWYLILQLKNLYHYYATAHVTSAEPEIRMVEQGIKSMSDYLLFYPRIFVNIHLGKLLASILLIILAASAVWYMINRRKKGLRLEKNESSAQWACLFGLAAPFIVLTIDISKSSVVICTVSGTAVFIAVYVLCLLYNKGLIGKRPACIIAVAAMGLGILNYVDHTTEIHMGYDRETQKQMLAINGCMEEYLEANPEVTEVKLLVDRICDAVTSDVLTVLTYENQDRYVDVGYAWNTINTYQDYSREEVEGALGEADIMVLSQEGYSQQSFYPTDASFDRYRDTMWEYANKNLINLGSFALGNDKVVIFAKGQAVVSSAWEDWMSDTGNLLSFTKQSMDQKEIVIEGGTGGVLQNGGVEAYVEAGELKIPSEMTIRDGRYELRVDISSLEPGRYDFDLTFSSFFVPKELGANEDTRCLVVMAPEEAVLK